MTTKIKSCFLIVCLFLAQPVPADSPVIENVVARQTAAGWQFDVTLSHPDSGWDHYADGWRVLDMDGNELGTRVLFHPHVDEQPFTRSIGGLQIPAGHVSVQVQSRCLIDGWSESAVTVPLD